MSYSLLFLTATWVAGGAAEAPAAAPTPAHPTPPAAASYCPDTCHTNTCCEGRGHGLLRLFRHRRHHGCCAAPTCAPVCQPAKVCAPVCQPVKTCAPACPTDCCERRHGLLSRFRLRCHRSCDTGCHQVVSCAPVHKPCRTYHSCNVCQPACDTCGGHGLRRHLRRLFHRNRCDYCDICTTVHSGTAPSGTVPPPAPRPEPIKQMPAPRTSSLPESIDLPQE